MASLSRSFTCSCFFSLFLSMYLSLTHFIFLFYHKKLSQVQWSKPIITHSISLSPYFLFLSVYLSLFLSLSVYLSTSFYASEIISFINSFHSWGLCRPTTSCLSLFLFFSTIRSLIQFEKFSTSVWHFERKFSEFFFRRCQSSRRYYCCYSWNVHFFNQIT